jgi:hypothetical protein
LLDQLQRLGGGAGSGGLVAGLLEPGDDELPDVLVVVDDEHPCHAGLPGGELRRGGAATVTPTFGRVGARA